MWDDGLLHGRYELVRELGSGASGALYQVRDQQRDDALLALKLLRARAPDPELVPLFRNEFVVLSDVSHPNIVAVQEFGVAPTGDPFFTMEYVPGESCRSYVTEDRLSSDDYLDFTAKILSALAHVHATGLIHRDVKPENIIMRRGAQGIDPVLVDFGLAMTAGAQRSGEASGTLPYIAPEVLAGGRASPASDLFSLGMVLFDLATGRHVAEFRELLAQPERMLAPARVRKSLRSRARSGVPRGFEDVVTRLIAPTPAERFRAAPDALRALVDHYGNAYAGGALEIVTKPVLGEAPLVGRDPMIKSLISRILALSEGRLLAPVAIVAGTPGAGVSRLLATVRNRASVLDCPTASGSSLRELAESVAMLGPFDRSSLGGTAADAVFWIDTALHEMAGKQTPALFLDNVHAFAEEDVTALREWVSAVEARPGHARFMLMCGGRNEGDSPGTQFLKTAGASVPIELRDLAPLRQPDIRRALAIVLGQARVPAEIVQELLKASGGNPRALNELLHLLVDEGVLDLSGVTPELDTERLQSMRLPRSIKDLARRRLRKLPAKVAQAAARLAMVPFAVPDHAARIVLGKAMRPLLEEGLVQRSRGRISFANEASRAAADSLQGDARIVSLRALAGELEETFAPAAAALLLDAGDHVRAVDIGINAARAWVKRGESEQACGLLERIHEIAPRTEVKRELFEVMRRIGRASDAIELGENLLDLERSPEFALHLAAALRAVDRDAEALAVLRLFDEQTDGEIAARITNLKSDLLRRARLYDEALLASRRAEEAAGSELGLGGRIAGTRSRIYTEQGRHQEAADLRRRALSAPADTMVFSVRESIRRAEGSDYRRLGDMRRALRLLRESQRRVRAEGGAVWAAHASFSIGGIFFECGRPRRAEMEFRRTRELYQRGGSKTVVAQALAAEARALMMAGRPAEAEARLLRAEGIPGIADVGLARSELEQARAWMRFLAGDEAGAFDQLKSVLDERTAPPERGPVVLELAHMAQWMSVDLAETWWRLSLAENWPYRRAYAIPLIRVGLARVAAARGAWNKAEQLLDRRDYPIHIYKTSMRAQVALLRAGIALSRSEPGAVSRYLEEAVAVVNHCGDMPMRARVYSSVASFLDEGELQRFLRHPTAYSSGMLLEAARDVWTLFGNQDMLRKVDLHLAELPQAGSGGLAGPEAERLVKVLHITRELNREFDRDRLLSLILDRAIELTQAERGFVILLEEGREQVRIARNIDRETVSEPERKMSSQIMREVIATGRIVRTDDAEADQRFEEYLSVRNMHLKSIIAVPFRAEGRTLGALYLDNRFRAGNFSDADERLLELFAHQAVAAIDKSELIRELKSKQAELEDHDKNQRAELRNRSRELKVARSELKQHRNARGWGFERIVSRSVAMQGVTREAKRYAPSDLSVLVVGENGTGKELLARAIHYESARQSMPFLAVNCAAFPQGMLEAELFGHVRGSFTGADRDRAGLFEEADGGTLFLDEIADMPISMQAKLLRTLEHGEIKRIGESKVRTVDVRVIAATNADLELYRRNGRVREDLYQRLNGVVLRIPPLRERLDDVEPLAYSFVEAEARRQARPDLTISNEAIARLESFSWTGNVRELRNVIARAVVTCSKDTIRPEDIKFDARGMEGLPGLTTDKADLILSEVENAGYEINTRQEGALSRVLTKGKISFGEYMQIFRVSKSTTARDLETLVSEGLLEKRGKTRAVVYLVGHKLQELAKKIGGK